MAILTSSQLVSASNATYFDNTAGEITPTLVRALNVDWISSSILVGQTGSMSVASASVAILANTASYVQIAQTASYVLNAVSASYALTSSHAESANNFTASNILVNGTITAGSASFQYLTTIYETSSVVYSSGSNIFGDAANDTQTLFGTVDIKTGPLLVTGSAKVTGSLTMTGLSNLNASHVNANDVQGLELRTNTGVTVATFGQGGGTGVTVVGNVNAAAFVGSGSGIVGVVSASHANNANNALTASYYGGSVVSASYAATASVLLGSVVSSSYATTASFASNAATASFVNTLNQDVLISGSLNVSQSITTDNVNLVRAAFSSNPFNHEPSSYLGAIRFGSNNQDFYLTNYNQGLTPEAYTTQSVVGLFVNTGSNYVNTYLRAYAASQSAYLNLTNANGNLSLTSNAAFSISASNSIYQGPAGTGVGTWFQNRVLISGPSTGETPKLYISGSDGAFTDLGRGNNIINTTVASGIDASSQIFANPAKEAAQYIGVYTPDTFVDDVEHAIRVDVSGISFNDFDNGSAFDYVPYMTLAPNLGNNPTPQMLRGLGVTGSLNALNGITGSLLGTAASASYVLNAVSASFTLNAATASSIAALNQAVVITGSVNGNVVSASISSNTASIDFSQGNFFTSLVSGSTSFNITNPRRGQTVNLLLTTVGVASASFSSNVRQVSGSAYTPTSGSSRNDILTFISWDGSSVYLSNVKNLV